MKKIQSQVHLTEEARAMIKEMRSGYKSISGVVEDAIRAEYRRYKSVVDSCKEADDE